ncbi:MAG: hypothetical protein HW398_396, partial [Acidobacteria bacterium]|nr:hypothetical protein [Acidobacteriota bacterium]
MAKRKTRTGGANIEATKATFDLRGQTVGQQFNVAGDADLTLNAPVPNPSPKSDPAAIASVKPPQPPAASSPSPPQKEERAGERRTTKTGTRPSSAEQARRQTEAGSGRQNRTRSKPSGQLTTASLSTGDLSGRRYVVFCRICGTDKFKADQLAGAQQVLITACATAKGDSALDVSTVHSSVYGRFLCVRNPVPALDTAIQVLDGAAKSGVRLAIGITVGRLEEVDDLGIKNLIGPPINLAARLAALESAEGKILVTEDVFDSATQSSHFAGKRFSEPRQGRVKRTEFSYRVFNHSSPPLGKLPHAGSARSFEAEVVVFDIVRFSEKNPDEQWEAVTALRRKILAVLGPIGGHDRAKKNLLWYAPAGDGGVLVFSSEEKGGDTAWVFARELSQQCRDQLEIRLGIATGSVVVVGGQLPVGT